MKKQTIIQILSGLLILLFVYAAVSKLTDKSMFAAQLTRFPVVGTSPLFFSWSIPITELVTAVLLFIPRYTLAGFYIAAAVLFVFTVFLLLMLLFAPSLPCSCGGVIAKLTWKQHIAFNLFFLIVSFTGICLKKKSKPSSLQNEVR